jgi:hypothetical protein
VAGIVVVTVAVLLLVGQAGNTSAGKPSTTSSVLKLVFGLLLLVMAVRHWRERPKPGEAAEMPKWMKTIDTRRPHSLRPRRPGHRVVDGRGAAS